LDFGNLRKAAGGSAFSSPGPRIEEEKALCPFELIGVGVITPKHVKI
jgi:hypothetical protein